jgi:flagellin-like protein
MRAITPVVAIIVLLLMTVAAAGMAFLTITSYQGQAESGTQGGIETIGTSTRTQIKIEAVAAGQIYIRNQGSETFENPRFYVEGRPIDVTGPDGCLSGKTCVFTITEDIECIGDCELSMGADMPIGTEVVVEEEELQVEELCGNGVCNYPTENGINCFVDCRENYMPYQVGYQLKQTRWNGTDWIFYQNITIPKATYSLATGAFKNSEQIIVMKRTDVGPIDGISTVFWNGASLSGISNVTEPTTYNDVGGGVSYSDSNQIFLVFTKQRPTREVHYSIWGGSSWSTPKNISISGLHNEQPSVDFNSTQGVVVWARDIGNYEIMSAIWNGTDWDKYRDVTDNIIDDYRPSIDFDTDERGIAVWRQESPGYAVYSVWDGDTWSQAKNVTDFSDIGTPVVSTTEKGTTFVLGINYPGYYFYYTFWNGTGWSNTSIAPEPVQ